jgi:hypothetical protein
MPSIQELMQDQRSPLANIFKQAQVMQNLTKKFNELVPPELKDQCSVINLRSGTLVLSVKHQGLISRIHYLKAELLALLRANEVFQYVKDIKVLGRS